MPSLLLFFCLCKFIEFIYDKHLTLDFNHNPESYHLITPAEGSQRLANQIFKGAVPPLAPPLVRPCWVVFSCKPGYNQKVKVSCDNCI